jgi:putative nucleotidyltransferase with HDIG domain
MAFSMGLLMALGYSSEGYMWVVFLMLAPLLLARYAWKLYLYSENARARLIKAFINSIEAKDKYTLGHSERVSKYATDIAKKLNLPDEQIKDVKIAGMLHDIGKIGIADEILNKPARLSKDEFEEMKRHPSIGTWILNNLNLSENTINAINYHHERFDGKGYPLGLKGKELSLSTQIVSLSDAYDAMTSDRPYRKAMSHREAIAELKKCSNTQFNPELVDLFDQAHMELTVLN